MDKKAMNEKIVISAVPAPWHGGVDLLVRQGNAFGVHVTMEEKNPDMIIDPTIRIGRAEAQTLMDDLWYSGIRPTEGTGSTGSLRATEKHLADMRKIAFKKLRIEG